MRGLESALVVFEDFLQPVRKVWKIVGEADLDRLAVEVEYVGPHAEPIIGSSLDDRRIIPPRDNTTYRQDEMLV